MGCLNLNENIFTIHVVMFNFFSTTYTGRYVAIQYFFKVENLIMAWKILKS